MAEGGIQLYAAGQTSRLSDTGAFPTILTLPDGTLLAGWEENGAITLTSPTRDR